VYRGKAENGGRLQLINQKDKLNFNKHLATVWVF